ncbi:DUF6542 domain-containing protein [Streptomyces sp. NPDC060194]|uniref:DUF6542 domain-containing protein n=1 Tax=Streptomyces sp. NPDC060194 TaxID=3347069 RepID=UPI003653AE01
MEQQHRTSRPRRDASPGAVPPPRERAAGGPRRRLARYRPAGRRPAPPVVLALRRLPRPRLTGLGAGLLATALLAAVAGLDHLFLDSTGTAMTVLYPAVAAACALWVRPADLVLAPVAAPIAYGVGAVVLTGGDPVDTLSALAVHAGWLYGGTLLAGVIALVRRVVLVRRHRNRRLRQAGTGTVGRAPRRD